MSEDISLRLYRLGSSPIPWGALASHTRWIGTRSALRCQSVSPKHEEARSITGKDLDLHSSILPRQEAGLTEISHRLAVPSGNKRIVRGSRI